MSESIDPTSFDMSILDLTKEEQQSGNQTGKDEKLQFDAKKEQNACSEVATNISIQQYEEDQQQTFSRRPAYMFKVTGKDVTLELLNAHLKSYVNVLQCQDGFLVFNTFKQTRDAIKHHFPKANIEHLPRDYSAFLKSFEDRPQQNFNSFMELHPNAEEVELFVRSDPQEQKTPQAAIKFARALLAALTEPRETIFGIRHWLEGCFVELHNEMQNFELYTFKTPWVQEMDKGIELRCIMKVKHVPAFLEAIQKFDRVPFCKFKYVEAQYKPVDDDKKNVFSILLLLGGFPKGTNKKVLNEVKQLVPVSADIIEQKTNILIFFQEAVEVEESATRLKELKAVDDKNQLRQIKFTKTQPKGE